MHKSLYEIEVPKEDVFQAIQLGIQRGKQYEKRTKRIKVTKRLGYFTSAAATLLLASGFVFSPITNVLAQAPIIGSIYEKYQLPVGKQLASEQLITEMSMIATDQNIQVEITSIFYDAAYVGITFTANGAVTDTIGGEHAPEAGFTFEMSDGEKTYSWESSKGTLTKAENGYTGAIVLNVPEDVTDDILSFPLTFTHMAGVQGEWSFDFVAEKLPTKQHAIDQQVMSKNKELSITFNEIQIGQTNARISISPIFESVIEGQTYTFEAYNQDEERLTFNQVGETSLLLELSDDISSIKIVPTLNVFGTETERLDSITIDVK